MSLVTADEMARQPASGPPHGLAKLAWHVQWRLGEHECRECDVVGTGGQQCGAPVQDHELPVVGKQIEWVQVTVTDDLGREWHRMPGQPARGRFEVGPLAASSVLRDGLEHAIDGDWRRACSAEVVPYGRGIKLVQPRHRSCEYLRNSSCHPDGPGQRRWAVQGWQ